MRLAIIFLSLLVFGHAKAQSEQFTPGLVGENEFQIGGLVHVRGLGASFQYAQHRTYKNFSLFDLSLYSVKHAKEIKVTPLSNEARPYVYGKENAMMVLRGGYGFKRIMAHQQSKDGVKLNILGTIGPNMAILKPVYYSILSPDNPNRKLTERFDARRHDYTNIDGAKPFFTGVNKSFFIPGASAKAAISVEWGSSEDRFISLEAGCLLDAFPVRVPIFATVDGVDVNKPLFANLFLTLSYGFRRF